MTPVEALQATLAAEHAAVYVFGVLGGRVSTTGDPRTAALLIAAYEAHRARRDQLRSALAARGETPVAPEPAYAVDARNRSAEHLADVALETELACQEVYAQLVGSSSGRERRWAVGALSDSATRSLSFGGSAEPWPGAPEL